MNMRNHALSSRGRSLLTALAVGLAAISLAVVTGAGEGAASGSKATTSAVSAVLGGAEPMPEPACPLNCLVIPSVSGIQSVLPSSASPYIVPATGSVTAWKLFLGKPKAMDRIALNERFGSPPQASISILQKIRTERGFKFKLQRKSPVVGLNRYLGNVVTFRLEEPLRAVKGQFVALTVPTWAPAFADGLEMRDYAWRASRQPDKCASTDPSSQLLVGSKRFYACKFSGSRLLYTARIKFD
ncbi:MAG: hypothetical protein WD181_03570 [Solirubrobacterales bacterium]